MDTRQESHLGQLALFGRCRCSTCDRRRLLSVFWDLSSRIPPGSFPGAASWANEDRHDKSQHTKHRAGVRSTTGATGVGGPDTSLQSVGCGDGRSAASWVKVVQPAYLPRAAHQPSSLRRGQSLHKLKYLHHFLAHSLSCMKLPTSSIVSGFGSPTSSLQQRPPARATRTAQHPRVLFSTALRPSMLLSLSNSSAIIPFQNSLSTGTQPTLVLTAL